MSFPIPGFDSLRGRLGAWLTLAVLLSFVAAFFAAEQFIDGKLYRQFDDELLRRARLLAGLIALEPDHMRESRLPEFELAAHRDFFQVFGRDGSTLLRSASTRGRNLPAPPDPGAVATWYDLVLPDSHAGRGVALRITSPANERYAGAVLVVAEETSQLEALDNTIHVALLVCFLVALLAVVGAGRLAIRAGLAPLESLRARLALAGSPGPAVRLDASAQPLELRDLVGSLQAALDSLHGSAERERRWARDLAHELRTPLAELRAVSEVGIAAGGDPRATLATAAEVARELEETTDAMLVLARHEAGVESPALEPLELAGALRAWSRRPAEQARGLGLSLALDLEEELWIQADESLLCRLVANLAGNALRHAPAGDVVRVRARRAAEGSVTLEVENQARHLQPGDLEHFKERFFRGPGVATTGRGSGLGLGIAEALARVMGAALQLSLRDGRFVAAVVGLRPLQHS